MAYMNQTKKAKIAAALKLVVPKDWKYSLAVRNHSTIVMTIKSAPIDLIGLCKIERIQRDKPSYMDINPYHFQDYYDGNLKQVIENIMGALNIDNHDRSDIQTDYFDVGHYVDLNVGRWDKAFEVTGKPAKAAKPDFEKLEQIAQQTNEAADNLEAQAKAMDDANIAQFLGYTPTIKDAAFANMMNAIVAGAPLLKN